MSGFATTIKLGRPTLELSFDAAVYPFGSTISYGVARAEITVRNWKDEVTRKINRKNAGGGWNISIRGASEEEVAALEGLNGISDANLALLIWNARAVPSERCVMETTTTFTLEDDPYVKLDKAYNAAGGTAQIAVIGVYTNYDAKGAQVTTNYYSSYNRATGVVTCTTPGAAGTVVYVNRTHNGVLGFMAGFKVALAQGFLLNNGKPAYDVSFQFMVS